MTKSLPIKKIRQRNVLIFLTVAAAALSMCCTGVRAQSGAGSIQGTIVDSTGAVVSGASIHVVNRATNVAVDTKSNSVGFYQVPSLFTGTYVLTVTAPGMKTFETSIELLVAQVAVINPTMTAGAVTQQVTVSADIVQLTTTDSGTISSTLENARINQLPMNGRNILQLIAETTPGLSSCQQDSNGACANGLMGYAMEYVSDGTTLQGREYGGSHANQFQFADPDSIQEARVETTGLSAQYATPGTGIMTTKSGTNQLHGSFFETARNSYWGIAKQRQNPSNYVSPPYIRNEFGASAGGPIVIPGLYHGKDKSFWFFAYERYSLAQVSGSTTTTPPVSWRNGDYSDMLNSSGVLQTLYDPNTTQYTGGTWTRQTFTQEYSEGPGAGPSNCNGDTNCIPINRLAPTANILFNMSPLPSPQYASVDPLVQNNLNAALGSETRSPQYIFRLDHVFTENNRAFLRFSDNPATYLDPNRGNGVATLATTVNGVSYPAGASCCTDYQYHMIPVSLGFTHVFSPTFTSETIASQQWFREYNNAAGTPLVDFESEMGLPNNFGEAGFPEIENIVFPPNGTQFIYGVSQIIDTLDENLTKTVGKHQMVFGGRYRHERFGFQPDMTSDNVQFNGYGTALLNPSTISTNSYTPDSNTGQVNADFFLGAAEIYSVNKQPVYEHFHDMEFDAYFQDNYHIARSLTLNLGLRWEAHPAMWEKYGAFNAFDLKHDAMVFASPISNLISEGYTTQAAINNDEFDGVKFETAQQAGMPSKLLDDDDDVFGPRFGVAWQPFGKWGTVLRGAYGLYSYLEPLYTSYKEPGKNNPYQINYSQNYTSASQSPDGLPNYLLRAPQTTASGYTYASSNTPVMGLNTTNAVNTASTTAILPGITDMALDTDYPVDLATNVNFTIEQPTKGNAAVRLSYIWSHGTNLDQMYEYNSHPSSFVWELQNGVATPNGGASVIGTSQANTYSTTATGPYDQTTWGGSNYIMQKSGWSNDNLLQAGFQRLYHRGIAWQISYVWQKSLRVGGNANRDNLIYNVENYANSGIATYSAVDSVSSLPTAPALPPPPPPGQPSYAYYKALNRFENYGAVDNAGPPKQQVLFNYVIDLPFGKGKRYLSNVNNFVNELVGGYQLAGDGNILSQDFTITATNWGPVNPIHYYKHRAPITDCRSGTCLKEFLWWNGYIAPTAISGNPCAAGLTAVVSGLPTNYAPYQTPMDTSCSAPSGGKAVTDKYFGDNEVNITLANGSTGAITYQPSPNTGSSGWAGANPFSKTVLNGPMNYTTDASLFKVFPINERFNLRFNMDVFNLLNVQGYNNPSGTDGTETLTSSYNSARQVQFTLRLNF
jgi:hypothetical protein